MSDIRRKIIETHQESYTIKLRTSPSNSEGLLAGGVIYIPGEEAETSGNMKGGVGYGIYFYPYKVPTVSNALIPTSAPANGVYVDIIIKDDAGNIIYNQSLQGDTPTNEKPYIGFALFTEESRAIIPNIQFSSYITHYATTTLPHNSWYLFEITVRCNHGTPLACVVAPLITRFKPSSDSSSKNAGSYTTSYASSGFTEVVEENDFVELNRSLNSYNLNNLSVPTYGFSHDGVRYDHNRLLVQAEE